MTEAQTARLQTIVTELENGDTSHVSEYNVLTHRRASSRLFGQPLHTANYAVAPRPVQENMKEVGIDTTSDPLESTTDNSARYNEKIALIAQVKYTRDAWKRDPDKLAGYTESLATLEQYELKEKERG